MTKKLMDGLRNLIVRGAVFIAPLWLSIVVVGFGYNLIESSLGDLTAQVVRWLLPDQWLTGRFAGGHIPGLSVLFALVLFSAIGLTASWHFGRQGLKLFDGVFLSLPILRSIYSAARKLFDAFGEPGGKARFQKVVFVDWPGNGARTIGFVTNELVPENGGEKRYVLFVPCMPNPTGGFVVVVPASKVVETEISPEEGLKFGLTLGVLVPPAMPLDKL